MTSRSNLHDGSVAAAGARAGGHRAGTQTPPAAESPSETKRVDPVVITATKIETSTADLTTAVTVITGEEIQSKHYTTLGDVLRGVPGLDVQRSGSLGKITTARIRGAGAAADPGPDRRGAREEHDVGRLRLLGHLARSDRAHRGRARLPVHALRLRRHRRRHPHHHQEGHGPAHGVGLGGGRQPLDAP